MDFIQWKFGDGNGSRPLPIPIQVRRKRWRPRRRRLDIEWGWYQREGTVGGGSISYSDIDPHKSWNKLKRKEKILYNSCQRNLSSAKIYLIGYTRCKLTYVFIYKIYHDKWCVILPRTCGFSSKLPPGLLVGKEWFPAHGVDGMPGRRLQRWEGNVNFVLLCGDARVGLGTQGWHMKPRSRRTDERVVLTHACRAHECG